MIQTNILFGIDQLLSHASVYKNKRIALVCNNASVTTNGIATRITLKEKGFNVVKLFSPEHGLNASGEDGHYQANGTDGLTGLPVTSLYGDRLAPKQEDLRDIDMVLLDLPDIGCRFYTYLWTMTHVMEACAVYNIPLLITDRPNPTGGNLLQAEGPMLDEATCSSFIGRWSLPVRHCCTLGELAGYFKATKVPTLQLTIMPVSNWQRQQTDGYTFTPTSPAIRHRSTALLYPGMGLLEGINVNEGRGTEYPFEVCAAPWINKEELHSLFLQTNHPGIYIEPVSYIAQNGLYINESCHGLKISVTDENSFHPVSMGISLIGTLLNLYPFEVKERLYDSRANPGGKAHLDKLLGIPHALNAIKNGENIITDISNEWTKLMKDYLLYQ